MKITIDEQKICSLVQDYVESMADLMQGQKIVQVKLNNDGEETFAEIHLGEKEFRDADVPWIPRCQRNGNKYDSKSGQWFKQCGVKEDGTPVWELTAGDVFTGGSVETTKEDNSD